MSVQALLCNNCGAALEPKVLETKVKCGYCATVYVIVRDHEGVRGVSPEGAAGDVSAKVVTTSGTTQSPHFGAGVPPGMDPAVVDRLERDALMAVRGLEAAAQTAVAARGLARVGSCGCLGVVIFALGLLGVVVALG